MPGIPGIPFVPDFPVLPRGPVCPGTPSPLILDSTSSVLLSSSNEDYEFIPSLFAWGEMMQKKLLYTEMHFETQDSIIMKPCCGSE